MFEERRKYMRFGTAIDGEFNTQEAGISGIFLAENFSRGGFKAALNRKVEKNSLLDWQINFPGTVMPIFATGKVVWVKERVHDSPDNFHAGVQLENVDTVEFKHLLDYCYKGWNETKKNYGKEFNIEA
ncbi:MAG: PilZ domain-containing protein [Candidatus Omnitrophica bacterium]|nr:PilZ domain-containing protein [Candidatus Omnitrophota bacterium]